MQPYGRATRVLYLNDDLVLAEVAWEFLAPFQAPVAVCGDGLIGVGESCDDGNTTDGDGCPALCQAEDEPILGIPTIPPWSLLALAMLLVGTSGWLMRQRLGVRG